MTPNISNENLYALKTICGAIHYVLTRYSSKEIPERDLQCLFSYLDLPVRTIYGVEVTNQSLLLITKDIAFKYVHSDFHEKRLIEFIDA